MRPLRSLLAAVALAALLPAPAALAWGNEGHRIIGQLAAESLGPELPAFLKTRQAIVDLGELSREPDRLRGTGNPNGADNEPAHFIDVGDDHVSIFGGPRLDAMPRDRKDYEAALQKVGENSWHAGFLYYALVDEWQVLSHDFAWWRMSRAGEKTAKNPADRAYFKRDRERREQLIMRDLGFLSHLAGDGSQPFHLTVHFNGWGPGPNPRGYSQDKIHAPVEAKFIERNVTKAMVKAKMYPRETCAPPIQACVTRHFLQTAPKIDDTFRLYGEGGFKDGDPRGIAFSVEGLAQGASRVRDLVEAAWKASTDHPVGYPNPQSPKEVETGGKPVDIVANYGIERDN